MPAGRDAARPPRVVRLASGASASAILQITDVSNFPPASCGRVAAAGLRVYPPNQTGLRARPVSVRGLRPQRARLPPRRSGAARAAAGPLNVMRQTNPAMRGGGGLLYAWGVNAVALWLASRLFGGVHVHGLREFLIAGAILGVANAVLKPLLTILTLPLVILSLGVLPAADQHRHGRARRLDHAVHASIHGFWTYAGTVVVIWLVNVAGSLASPRASRRRAAAGTGDAPERGGGAVSWPSLLIWRNLLRRPARTIFTAVGVGLGVGLIIALLAISNGVAQTAGDLTHVGGADFGLYQVDVSDFTRSLLPESLAAQVLRQPDARRGREGEAAHRRRHARVRSRPGRVRLPAARRDAGAPAPG